MSILTETFIVSLLLAIILLVKDSFNTEGFLLGIGPGIIISIIELRRCYRSAEKEIFVSAVSKRKTRMFFIIMISVSFFAGGIIFFALKKYFPDYDIFKTLAAAIVPLGMCSAIGAIGIWKLERQYGKSFYIEKSKS